MPAMLVCGRRCAVATDDFFFIGVADAIFFLPWLGLIPVVYAEFLQHRFECLGHPNLVLLDISLPGLCALFFLNWCLGLLFIIFSARGTVSKPEPRRHVVKLVYLKFVVSLLDIVWAILGSVILYGNFYCDIYSVGLLIKVVTIVQWVMTVVRIWMILLFYDCFACKNSDPENIVQKTYFSNTFTRNGFRRWNLRFQTLFLLCATPSKAKKEAITTASELMSLLSSDLDLVPSDVLTALLLHRRKDRSAWKRQKAALEATPAITRQDGTVLEEFPPPELPEWMNLELARRYFHIGMGVFGWAWTVYRDPACGCCKVARKLTCCLPCRSRYAHVLGDNCCGCSVAGLMETSDLLFESLVHVSFVDRVFEIPFFVCVDHETRAVVVTARGTMSGDDVLTDVCAGFAAADEPGCPPGSLCHAGMLSGAREIRRKMEDGQLLEGALRRHPGYRLVLTGHSLGAAVASLLAMLLRGAYPDLRCFAFAPPPAFNRAALPATFGIVFSVVFGNDSVPFLNYYNVRKMVEGFAACLEECDLPKYKVLLCPKQRKKMAEKSVAEIQNEAQQTNGSLHAQEDTTAVEIGEDKSKHVIGENGIEADSLDYPGHPEGLFVGGTILHVWNTKKGHRLKLCTASFYKDLKFHPNMILHHFPHFMEGCLDELGKTPTFRPSKEDTTNNAPIPLETDPTPNT